MCCPMYTATIQGVFLQTRRLNRKLTHPDVYWLCCHQVRHRQGNYWLQHVAGNMAAGCIWTQMSTGAGLDRSDDAAGCCKAFKRLYVLCWQMPGAD